MLLPLGDLCFGLGFSARILAERLRTGLARAGLQVLEAGAAGCGDAGLALGQAWIAAAALRAGRADATPSAVDMEA